VENNEYPRWDRRERPLPRGSWLGHAPLDASDLLQCHWEEVSIQCHGRFDLYPLHSPANRDWSNTLHHTGQQYVASSKAQGNSNPSRQSRIGTYPTPSEEPKHNQHIHVRRESARNREDKIPQVASMVDVTTAVELTERSDQDRSKCEAEQVAVYGSVTDELKVGACQRARTLKRRRWL
jgi:hypothetical protein